MAIAFVLDEHFQVQLYDAILRHNMQGGLPIDVEQVGGPADLPSGTLDPDLLIWAERNGRIIVTRDVTTLPADFHAHLVAGRHSPGVFEVRPSASLGEIVSYLELATHAADPSDFADIITFIP